MELVSAKYRRTASRTDVSFHQCHLSMKIKSTPFIQKKKKKSNQIKNSLHLQLIRGNFMILFFNKPFFFLYN